MGPLAIAAIPGLIKMASGAIQTISGKRKLKKAVRPGYEIMGEFKDNQNVAAGVKSLGYNREQYLNTLREVGRNSNSTMIALGRNGNKVAGAGVVAQRANDAVVDLGARVSTERNRNFVMGSQMQMNANSAMAAEKINQMKWDKFGPYQQKVAEGQAMLGAGMQNVYGGVDDLSSLAVTDLAYNGGDGIDGLFGGGGKAPVVAPRAPFTSATFSRAIVPGMPRFNPVFTPPGMELPDFNIRRRKI